VSRLQAVGIELRTLLELYFVPGLCALLPWPLGYRWLRLCSRWTWLFEPEWRASLAEARRWVAIVDEQEWARRYRIYRLVDNADYWLSRTRSRRWLARHADAQATWPRPGRLRWACSSTGRVACGRCAHCMPPGRPRRCWRATTASEPWGHSWLGYLYGYLRLSELARASGRPLIFSPSSVKKALAELKASNWVIRELGHPHTTSRTATEPARVNACRAERSETQAVRTSQRWNQHVPCAESAQRLREGPDLRGFIALPAGALLAAGGWCMARAALPAPSELTLRHAAGP